MIKRNRRSLIIVLMVIASLLLLTACMGTQNGDVNDNTGTRQNYRTGQTGDNMNNQTGPDATGGDLTGNRANRLNNDITGGINGIDGNNMTGGIGGVNGNNSMNGTMGNNRNAANGTDMTSVQQRANKLKAELEKVSGVSDVSVLITGDTAIIGCKTNQSLSEIKNRLTEKAKSVDPSIKNVAVTNANNILTEMKQLSSDMMNGNATDLDNKIRQLLNKITPNNNP